MTDKFKERVKEADEIRERLKGSCLHEHPHLGRVMRLSDGTFLSLAEYKALYMRTFSWLWRRG